MVACLRTEVNLTYETLFYSYILKWYAYTSLQISGSGWFNCWAICLCGSEEDKAQCWEGHIHFCQEHSAPHWWEGSFVHVIAIVLRVYIQLFLWWYISCWTNFFFYYCLHCCLLLLLSVLAYLYLLALISSLFVFSAAMMSAIYEENKDEDGFLYMTYSGENTFGFL